MERRLEREFETYFGENLADVTQTPAEISKTLATLAHKTGSRAGVLWVIPREQELHLVLLLPDGAPIVKDFPNVPRDRLLETVRTYQREISDPSHDPKTSTAARQLYDWIIAPYEREHLSEAEIDSLLFCLGSGLRGLPLAALQKPNGQYLVEQYSLTSIPAFNLIDTRYRPAKRGRILAAGASLFDQLTPLPAVPMELEIVRSELRDSPESTRQWQGRSLLNQNFTLNNLKEELDATQFNIIHLATHADFKPGDPKESFIQFQDQPLRVGDLGAIPWPENLDLLVLSACKTAIGDPDAELGFSGVALKAQIKSAIGSLWSVSDLGTLALMSEFYHQLPQAPTRAIALQQAQLRLLRGEVRVGDNRLLHAQRGSRSLPSAIALGQNADFTHPYFWAGFTMISSPW
ncbi:MAG: CHAT domain-containing protein [Cyanobacteria bacterium P01_F01_bin.42]